MCGGVHKCIAKFILVCANVLQHLLFTYKKQGLCVTRKWIVAVKVDFDNPLSGESGLSKLSNFILELSNFEIEIVLM